VLGEKIESIEPYFGSGSLQEAELEETMLYLY
jgi:hypothetical protein